MAEQTKERPNRTDGAKSMTTHDNDKAHDAAERELFEAFANAKLRALGLSFEMEDGEYVDESAERYFSVFSAGRSALTASEAKTVDAAKVRKLRDLAKEGREEADSWALDGYTGPWKLMERMADAIDILLKSSPPEAQQPAQQDGWVSVEERKPAAGVPVLVAVRWIKYGEDDDGRPFEHEGIDVTEGECRDDGHTAYMMSYISPHGDAENITHWQLLPAPPAP